MSKVILFFLFFAASYFSAAQVSGIIKDSKTGKPLSGVEVFMNRTTIVDMSDQNGLFKLSEIPVGFIELVLYKKGYALFRSPMQVQKSRLYELNLLLEKEKRSYKVVTAPNDLIHFKESLIGNKAKDKILNEEDILISSKIEQDELHARAPILIENNSLGYQMKAFFFHTSLRKVLEAPIKYEYLPAENVQQSIEWEKNRQELFRGSLRHWLLAMIANQTKEEGFLMKDLSGNALNEKTLISALSISNVYRIDLSDPIQIVYIDGKMEATSRISSVGVIDINERGLALNPKLFKIEGDMLKREVTNQLPDDYKYFDGDVKEHFTEALGKLYEKVYVNTDKPYYYPGEAMWFKAYLNYNYPAWRDSLSKVLYIELINPQKKIVLEKILKIDSGFAHNDFILPDTLTQRNYFLRAYTNLMRNFGETGLFAKPIPILKITDKADHTKVVYEAPSQQGALVIKSEKDEYKTRERIELTLQVKDKNGIPIASNVSVSVTDAVQVIPVPEWGTINPHFRINNDAVQNIQNFIYPAESGITFSGQFLNDQGKTEKTILDIVQLKPRLFVSTETDERGLFKQTGFEFYDTATFSFKSDKAKELPYGRVELNKRDLAKMDGLTTQYSIATIEAGSVQRLISEYEVPKGDKLLAGVLVKGKRIINPEPVDRIRRSYGAADFAIAADQLNTTYANLLYAIQGKMAGLVVNAASQNVYFTRAGGLSVSNMGGGPLVTVDDVPLGDASDPGDGSNGAGRILSSINPNTVESIEFTRRLSVLYGSQGVNGVISVYTKKGASGMFNSPPNFQKIKVIGYSRSRLFRHPDYNDPQTDKSLADYRSTIYWNPNVMMDSKTGSAKISFFSADLPGFYRVVAEGVTQDSEPVRCEYYFRVESR
jgi:hypothetical protein